MLHLLIEAGDQPADRRIGLGAYLTYTLNFTTFVSGPIQRYDEFARDQFAEQPIALGARVVGLQMERIIRGFFKVNVLAMLLKMMQADALAQMLQPCPCQSSLCGLTGCCHLSILSLRKLLGLHRHRHRTCTADARASSGKLRSPVSRLLVPGLLESLAHHVVPTG